MDKRVASDVDDDNEEGDYDLQGATLVEAVEEEEGALGAAIAQRRALVPAELVIVRGAVFLSFSLW